MTYESALTVQAHRRWLKQNLEQPFSFHSERFTGFAVGPFFYVIHHAQFEYDRRYHSPKNAALGFMRSTPTGCRLRFMTFRGLLCPSQFLLVMAICYFLSLFPASRYNDVLTKPVLLAILLGVMLICAGVNAFVESLSDRSEEGRDKLLYLLSGNGESK